MSKLGSSRLLSGFSFVAAVAYLVAIAFFVMGAPRGWIGYREAFDSLRILAYVGAIATVGALVVLAMTIRFGRRWQQGLAAVAALGFLAPVIIMALFQGRAPAGAFINDITTDPGNPPAFSAVVPLRPANANSLEYGGEAVAARQRELYPDLEPIFTPLQGEPAFRRAFESAEAMGWEIVAGDLQNGIIEAVATTAFFRFKDDVVIRITTQNSGSRIDLRSRSRLGASDLGKNASRIRKYIRTFENQ